MPDVVIPNLARFFVERARANPKKIAIHSSSGSFTYGDLLALFDRFREGIQKQRIRRGQRVLMMMPVSVELYALFLALLSSGVICVSIDLSLPRAQVLNAIEVARPDVIISVDRLLKFRFLLPLSRPRFLFDFLRIRFFSADSKGLGLHSLNDLLSHDEGLMRELEPARYGDLALITYTTGTTGRPKGADRATDILSSQHQISEKLWPHTHNEIDMPCFPMVGLQNLSCGITTVLPELDARKLDAIDAKAVVQRIRDTGVTRISGPPSFFDQVSRFLIDTHQTLPSVHRLVTGGAPVPRWLCANILKAFPNAEAHVVYGSTEAEPMAAVRFQEAIQAQGEGYLMGYPIDEIELKIIESGHPFIESMTDQSSLIVKNETLGEIVVKGPHVVRRYLDNEAANAETKIKDPSDGLVWHRTGDEGYIDSLGRVWLVGRINDRIRIGEKTFAHFPIERAIEQAVGARRAAVLSLESKVYVFIEASESLTSEQEKAIRGVIQSRVGIDSGSIQVLKTLPVDHRHFWRIDRNKLRAMIS